MATPLFLYSVQDYGCGWRAASSETKLTVKNAYKLGVNLAVYAARGRETLTIGLVKHTGSWNHHLIAYDNLKREILARTRIKTVDVVHVEPATSDLSKCDFANISS